MLRTALFSLVLLSLPALAAPVWTPAASGADGFAISFPTAEAKRSQDGTMVEWKDDMPTGTASLLQDVIPAGTEVQLQELLEVGSQDTTLVGTTRTFQVGPYPAAEGEYSLKDKGLREFLRVVRTPQHAYWLLYIGEAGDKATATEFFDSLKIEKP